MNPVLAQASGIAEHAWLMGVVTIVFMAFFAAVTWWAYARRNRARFEQAARLPLMEDEP